MSTHLEEPRRRRPVVTGRRAAAEDGFTLVEQLVTIVLLGIGVTAILGAVLTVITVSHSHRDLSNAAAVLASAAERVASPDTTRVACATPDDYRPAAQGAALPSGWSAGQVDVEGVRYWQGGGFATADFDGPCRDAAGFRLQQVTVVVRSGDASERVDVLKWDDERVTGATPTP